VRGQHLGPRRLVPRDRGAGVVRACALSQSPSSTTGSAPRGGPWASSCPRPSTTAPSPAAVGAPLGPEDRELPGKPLLNTAVHKGLPTADALLEMPVLHLPSPVEAQQYRV
jgi:hypothetical protein